jgi:hypothetical protein
MEMYVEVTYFTKLSVSQMIELLVINELERMWKEAVVTQY